MCDRIKGLVPDPVWSHRNSGIGIEARHGNIGFHRQRGLYHPRTFWGVGDFNSGAG